MRVTPITAEDANAQASSDPWPPGDYDFVVQDASEGISNAGNEQIKLTLQVYNRNGNARTVFDYLPASAKAPVEGASLCRGCRPDTPIRNRRIGSARYDYAAGPVQAARQAGGGSVFGSERRRRLSRHAFAN